MTKRCPEGTDPCSNSSSLDHTICYSGDRNENCPLTGVYFEMKSAASNMIALSNNTNATAPVNPALNYTTPTVSSHQSNAAAAPSSGRSTTTAPVTTVASQNNTQTTNTTSNSTARHLAL